MNQQSGQIDVLLEEYKSFVHEALSGTTALVEGDWDRVESILRTEGDWSPKAAPQLVRLAREYGAFVLRNALALAMAAGIEDGSSGI
jgi:hypothetical protein